MSHRWLTNCHVRDPVETRACADSHYIDRVRFASKHLSCSRPSSISSPLSIMTNEIPDIVKAYIEEQMNPFNFSRLFFNITEDLIVDSEATARTEQTEDALVDLLYQPLPNDLPVGNKDLLIYAEAYNGDIDRYSRLRRPNPLNIEHNGVICGIHHNTIFAKWWSIRPRASSPARIMRCEKQH